MVDVARRLLEQDLHWLSPLRGTTTRRETGGCLSRLTARLCGQGIKANEDPVIWHPHDFMKLSQALDPSVQSLMIRQSLSSAQAAESLRQAIFCLTDDQRIKLSATECARVALVLYDRREQELSLERLGRAMANHPSFAALPLRQAWHMVLDQHAWPADTAHSTAPVQPFGFEEEPGYMGGMLRGLALMLEADQQEAELDLNLLVALHDEAIAGVFKDSIFRTVFQRISPYGMDQLGYLSSLSPKQLQRMEDLLQNTHVYAPRGVSLVPSGLRPHSMMTLFGLNLGENLTLDGLREMAHDPHYDDHYMVRTDQGIAVKLLGTTPSSSTTGKDDVAALDLNRIRQNSWPRLTQHARSGADDDAIADRGRQILSTFRQAQVQAQGDHRLLLEAVVRCCQSLERAHLFSDGNARTVGFLVLNKLLLECGLAPCMFPDHNRFDGYSVAELVSDVRRGQHVFSHHVLPTDQPSTSTAAPLKSGP